MKEKYELEFILNSSPRILEKMFSSPDGLGEWFADDVTVKDDVYTFSWDGSSEQARLVNHKLQSRIRFKWLADEEDDVDSYFEIGYNIDPITNQVALNITDFAIPEDKESAVLLWNQQVTDLKRILGA
ncbi:MAG: START-like domain-containing protein [Crocinitomicaceae bacterium]|jgi:hypothetical protein